MAAILLLAIGYAYVWQPMARDRDRLLERLPMMRTEADQMTRDAQELATLGVRAHAAAAGLEELVRRTLAEHGIELSAADIKATNVRGTTIVASSIPAPQALRLLAALQREQPVQFGKVRISALGNGERLALEVLILAGQ
jgi:type II secretory pathway component PulM